MRMVFVFRVAYGTVVGESLWLEMTLHGSGGSVRQEVPMKWLDDGHWQVEVDAEISGEVRLEYGYVYKKEGVVLREAGKRVWSGGILEVQERTMFLDDWQSFGSEDRIYSAKAFHAIEGEGRVPLKRVFSGNHEFVLYMTRLPAGFVPCVTGNLDVLGEWDYDRALPMVEVEENTWRIGLNLPFDFPVEYKYGLYDTALGEAVKFEDGEGNRVLDPSRKGAGFVRISDEGFRRSADLKFRAAGVAIPVFSLRSEEGCGVGEFADLKAMGDWGISAGLKMLQILPVNDTTSTRTWTDSYPYSAISVFALHPIYLRLDLLSYPLSNLAEYHETRDHLNKAKQLDYEAVMAVKWRVTREVFDEHHDAILRDKAFLAFLKTNWDWVLDYGVFCVKRDEFGTADFSKWGEWATYDSKTAEALAISTDVIYFVWLQYELDRQLSDAVAYLGSIGVALKGDLPIGVDRESVDAWVAPRLFKMNFQTGAPPDAFAVKGQNWGFPTYDWEEMSKDGYAWWKARFAKLSRYFDAYRIDHILGFFRIWQIPAEQVEGIMGWFEPAVPVKLDEFEEREIAFDYERFCSPFIREETLKKTFGEFAEGIRQDFLIDQGLGCYALKSEFSTQRKIEQFFDKLGDGDWANKQWIQEALYDLVSNVLFFEVPGSGGAEFHPRMSLAGTTSFAALDPDLQAKLRTLHDEYFYQNQEACWEAAAYEKLPVMRAASDMLLCGEDLGMVPACVPGVMRKMGMLSLEIQRWPKGSGSEFFHPDHAPYRSVVATGTHDMSTLRGWWQEDEQVRARFAWELFGIAFPEKNLSPEMARRIIEQHLWSPAMWALFPLQDLLATHESLRSNDIVGERINVPAIIPFYWRWRMEMTIPELASAADFSEDLKTLITSAGR